MVVQDVFAVFAKHLIAFITVNNSARNCYHADVTGAFLNAVLLFIYFLLTHRIGGV